MQFKNIKQFGVIFEISNNHSIFIPLASFTIKRILALRKLYTQ